MAAPTRSDQFTGTEPMRSGLEIDAGAVQAYFVENIEGFAGAVAITQFKGGQSNPTYRIDAGGRSWVLRRKPPGKLIPSAHAVDREYRAIKALADSEVPVPEAYALCEDDSVLGTAFYVMEHVEGRVFWEIELPGMSTAERAAIYDAMIETVARLHALDWQAAGLGGFGNPSGYVARQLRRWGGQYLDADAQRIPEMDRLITWLDAHLPEAQETALVHGNYTLNNLIFHPTEPRVVAVIDWELSTLGDPIADFAYNVMPWRVPREPYRGFSDADIATLGIPSEDEYVAAYCRHCGRGRIDDWNFYITFNLFKRASIAYGILVRQSAGTAASAHASQTAALAEPLARLAWQQIVDLGLD